MCYKLKVVFYISLLFNCNIYFRFFVVKKIIEFLGIRGNGVSEFSILGVGLVRVDNISVEKFSSLRGKKMV